ncbi:hypothetical protein [Rossellomorea sp. NS-SX7]|uniref:hypothetical protein n=1 Tax=Rossellomorea sp. NS-SX7 TaxID=3463856 RepID=UPI0040580246
MELKWKLKDYRLKLEEYAPKLKDSPIHPVINCLHVNPPQAKAEAVVAAAGPVDGEAALVRAQAAEGAILSLFLI